MMLGRDARLLRAFRDDEGSTSLAMVLSVFLVVCLLAVTLQVYWVNSTAGDVQTVADLAAMSGANTMSKVFSTYQFLDGLILGMSLTLIFLRLLAIIVSWIPFVQAAAPALNTAAGYVTKARDAVQTAADAFMKTLLQIAPFLSVANSVAVVEQNNAALRALNRPGGYIGACIPLPFTVDIKDDRSPPSDDPIDVGRQREVGKEHEKYTAASEDTTRAVVAGFVAAEDYRSVNPSAGNIDAWGDSYEKVGEYYLLFVKGKWSFEANARDDFRSAMERLTSECDSGGTLWPNNWEIPNQAHEKSQSALRTYVDLEEDARQDINGWRNIDTLDVFNMKKAYILKEDLDALNSGGVIAYHTSGCSRITARLAETRIVAELWDHGTSLRPCELCRPVDHRALRDWAAATAGLKSDWDDELAAYRKWQSAKSDTKKAEQDAADLTTDWVKDGFLKALQELAGFQDRAEYDFPGHSGFVAVVSDPSTQRPPSGMLYGLVGKAAYGPRVAVAGAMLAPTTDNLFMTMFDDVSGGDPPWNFLAAGGSFFMDTLGWVLRGYTSGVDGLLSGIKKVLGGGWFADKVTSAIESALDASGLDPPDSRVVKPVLVNTYYLGEDGSAFKAKYQSLKQTYDSVAVYAASPETAKAQLKTDLRDAVGGVVSESLDQVTFELVIEIGGQKFPVPIQLPGPVKEGVTSAIDGKLEELLNAW